MEALELPYFLALGQVFVVLGRVLGFGRENVARAGQAYSYPCV